MSAPYKLRPSDQSLELRWDQHYLLSFPLLKPPPKSSFMPVVAKQHSQSHRIHSPAGSQSDTAPSRKQRSHRRDNDDHTAFRGVRRRKWGRYVSEIRLPGQKTRIWLGSFGSPEMAARAYDSAAFFLKGDPASLNFPDSIATLPQPVSCSRRDIQLAAAKAAVGDQQPVASSRRNGVVEVEECKDWWEELGSISVDEGPLMSPWAFGSMDEGLGLTFSIGEEDLFV